MKLGETLAAVSDDQSVQVSVSNCGIVVEVLGHCWVFAIPRGRSDLVYVCHSVNEGAEGHRPGKDYSSPADCPGCRDLFQTVKPVPPSAGAVESTPKSNRGGPARRSLGEGGRKQ